MRRNWDTIRTVLLAVEAEKTGAKGRFANETQLAHFWMLRESGFVFVHGPGPELTHAGRDLLDAIRDDRVWAACQGMIAKNAGGLPTDAVVEIARCAIARLASAV